MNKCTKCGETNPHAHYIAVEVFVQTKHGPSRSRHIEGLGTCWVDGETYAHKTVTLRLVEEYTESWGGEFMVPDTIKYSVREGEMGYGIFLLGAEVVMNLSAKMLGVG